MKGSSQAVPVDIETPYLETSMRRELDSLSPLSSACCIYKVPHRLRRVNEKAYTPQVVSIGPLHHGEIALEATEEHKKRYLQDFLCRTDVSLEEYIKIIRDKEARLRSCYAEPIKFSSDQFVGIILVDAAFIIEFLWRHNGLIESKNEDDRIFNNPWMYLDLRPDTYLLENQLPFFILEDILDLAKTSLSSSYATSSAYRHSIPDLFVRFSTLSTSLLPRDEEINSERIRVYPDGAEHFLDLIRLLCQPRTMTSQVVGSEQFNFSTIPSITDLHRAGVTFKVGSNENRLYIQFHDGILEIPKIATFDDAEVLFRNLLAFDQCHCLPQPGYISDFILVMDRFVNSPEDVDLLVKYGIVENALGDSREVSNLFNTLGSGICSSTNLTYAVLPENLNKYCSSAWHRMMANLRHNYFNTPWTTLSVIAAVVLLVLTLIQTVFSILSFASA